MHLKRALRTTWDWVFPDAAERDPAFRAEIERRSVLALRTIGWINVIMPATGLLVHMVAQVVEPMDFAMPYWPGIFLFFALGSATVLVAKRERVRRRARLLTLLNGFFSGAFLIWIALFAVESEAAEITSLLNIVVVLLVGVAIVPALPWQIGALGGALASLHFVSARLSVILGITQPVSLHHYAGLDIVVLLCVALAALNYRKLYETYTAHRSEIEAQERLLVSENAAILGKFAATISHELNSPLGAITSALDSLERLENRRAQGEISDTERTKDLSLTLIQTAQGSLGNLRQAVQRMQRFTNLDRSEALSVDIRQLLSDVMALLEPEWEGKIALDLECGELPRVTVRPQQISAVLAKLLRNAIRVSPPQGRVELVAQPRNGAVEVSIRDRGPGLAQDDIDRAFEPGFQVQDGRVRAGRWGLFSSRQVVREHGGDLSLESRPGGGVMVTMTLPVVPPFETAH